MKTSNIIVTVLFASITLILTTGMVEYRIKGVPRGSVVHKQKEIKRASVLEFHYAVVEDARSISLENADAFEVETPVLSDSAVQHLSYRVQNDTLYIKGSPQINYEDILIIKAPAGQLKGIYARHAEIIVGNFSSDRFVVRANNAHVSINAHETMNTLVIEGLNESIIDFFEGNAIGTLDLNLDHSEIHHFGLITKLKGSIRNQSKAELKNISELTFVKDHNSRLSVWTE